MRSAVRQWFVACGTGAIAVGALVCSAGAATFGTPVAWGLGVFGQTNVPPDLTNVIAVAAGANHNLALRADGTVVGWGGLDNPFSGKATPPAGLNEVVAIAAGAEHSLALKRDGTVVAWGDNASGQTNVPSGLQGVQAIAAGAYHNLALLSNGLVVAWGANNFGQSTVPPNVRDVIAIAAGTTHSLALLRSGQVVGWGDNSVGQINTLGLANIAAIAAGDKFTLAMRVGGQIVGLGQNNLGQATPPPLVNTLAMAAGYTHGLAVLSNRTVTAWGDNSHDKTRPPAGLTNVVAVAAGAHHSLALVVLSPSIVRQPQSQAVVQGQSVTLRVEAVGGPPLLYQWFRDGQPIAGANGPEYVIAAARPEDAGTYVVQISNDAGTVTSAPITLTVYVPPFILQQPQSIATNLGASIRFRVEAGGTPPLRYQWRHNGQPLPRGTGQEYFIFNVQRNDAGEYTVVVSNDYGAVTSAVAILTVHNLPAILVHPQSQTVPAGSTVTFSVTAVEATTYQWRKNGVDLPGQTNATLTLIGVQPADAGDYSVVVGNAFGGVLSQTATLSVLEMPTGTPLVVSWGENPVWNGSSYVDVTPPAALSNIVAIAAGVTHGLALSGDGRVFGWGDNRFGQAAPPNGLSNVVEIAAGAYHNLALLTNGTVRAWGRNDFSQATPPPGLSNVVALAAGSDHSLALLKDGTVIGWGRNDFGQATPPPQVTNLVAIAAGANHSLGRRADGTVVGWGANDFGQARAPSGLSQVVALAAGSQHSLALLANGRVVAWGANTFGQTNVPGMASNVVAIACGDDHCLALRADGIVVAWGKNNFGQTEPPEDLRGVIAIAAGGSRSLALRGARLVLGPPVFQPSGFYRIEIRTTDGRQIASNRVSGITVWVSPEVDAEPGRWTPLPGPVQWFNGRAFVDDLLTKWPKRFYRASESASSPK